MNLLFPRRLERETILTLLSDLDLTRNLEDVSVDFGNLRYSRPTAMLVAGSKLRDWWRFREENGYRTTYQGVDRNIEAHSYLMHLGFFDFLDMPLGNQIGEARGTSRYLPITRIPRPLIKVSEAGLEQWYFEIGTVSRRLAAVIAGSNDDSEALRAYTYSLREVIRNVFEHSGADECFVCGQRWWNGGVEIAVIDEGIGICHSLREVYEVESDDDALRMAIQPGTSRTSSKVAGANLYDNSGFGLFILSELSSSFGWFVLGSGGAHLVGRGRHRTIEDSSFSGTYFGMRLERSPNDFGAVLSEIIDAGEAEAQVAGISARASGRTRIFESF